MDWAYLVGARILKEDNALLFQEQSRLLGKEQVGALDDILEIWFTVRVDQVRYVRDVDGFWSTTTWYKEIGLDSEMEVVSEICSIGDDFSSYMVSVIADHRGGGTYKEAEYLSGQRESGTLRVRASPWQRS